MTRRTPAISSPSRTISILVLFLICVVGVVFIFSFVTGLIKFGVGSNNSFDGSGVFSIAGGGGTSGTLVVQVYDKGSSSVTGVRLTCSAQFQVGTCSGISLQVNGTSISAANPLPHGATASAKGVVRAAPGLTFTPATIYTVEVTVTFSDGTTSSQSLSLPAQA